MRILVADGLRVLLQLLQGVHLWRREGGGPQMEKAACALPGRPRTVQVEACPPLDHRAHHPTLNHMLKRLKASLVA